MSNEENDAGDQGNGSNTNEKAVQPKPTEGKDVVPSPKNKDSQSTEMDGITTTVPAGSIDATCVEDSTTTTKVDDQAQQNSTPATSDSRADTAPVDRLPNSKTGADDTADGDACVSSMSISNSSSNDEQRRTSPERTSSTTTDKLVAPTVAEIVSAAVATTTVSSDETTFTNTTASSSSSSSSSSDSSCTAATLEKVSFKVIYDRKKYDVELPLSHTILKLKEYLSPIIGVMPPMQKVMIKGLATDEKTLADLGVTRTSKVMVVGSKFDEVMSVNSVKATNSSTPDTSVSSSSKKEPLSSQKLHKKILDKGLPEDVHPGVKGRKEALPYQPISGMVNKVGGKVRLTFKLELDQVWIGTKQRTEKINMNSIRSIVSEPIEGHEQYHIMGLQMGPTEASRYWLYWVPAQYVDAIKATVLGGSSW